MVGGLSGATERPNIGGGGMKERKVDAEGAARRGMWGGEKREGATYRGKTFLSLAALSSSLRFRTSKKRNQLADRAVANLKDLLKNSTDLEPVLSEEIGGIGDTVVLWRCASSASLPGQYFFSFSRLPTGWTRVVGLAVGEPPGLEDSRILVSGALAGCQG